MTPAACFRYPRSCQANLGANNVRQMPEMRHRNFEGYGQAY